MGNGHVEPHARLRRRFRLSSLFYRRNASFFRPAAASVGEPAEFLQRPGGFQGPSSARGVGAGVSGKVRCCWDSTWALRLGSPKNQADLTFRPRGFGGFFGQLG